MLSIVGGIYKGRKIKTPKGQSTRPTSSQLREAFFNIIQTKVNEANFLDLFAGSGAIGIEALSRGANHVTFIEKDKGALHCLKENIEKLEISDKSTILSGDLFFHLKKLRKTFDIIYADPPYGNELTKELVNFIENGSLLKPGGYLFIEESKKAIPNCDQLETLTLIKERHFGRSVLLQFQKNNSRW